MRPVRDRQFKSFGDSQGRSSRCGIFCTRKGAKSSAGKRAEALGEMGWEVKVGALHKVPMWDFVQAVVVATRVLEIRRRRGCLGASRFDAGSARFIMV
ncbi:hypothetical protein L3X38_003468 [Prunus dulcis]|uniref:Uncharacterized protein n=1 Tax=Prunus dulcis TaxID=3755 RepID=A0AAD4ZM56_PRUDU|nr:hypothetical protein L3X38_003468 [Prunus dulcis]